ncbi:MAG: FmdB family transcriptional regulator [Austwickia sp.]|jgi:putative FmdB family regulatory protein|nr:MAG: FmdB family transcriptional regulator [Austwickia sp.]
MPTYAYACTDCDHHFEVRQSFTEDALTDCPQCDGRLRKLFNAVGVVFKGSGFYRTDSRSSSSSTIGSGKSSNSSSGDSSGGSSSSATGSAGSDTSSGGGAASGGSSSGSATTSGSAAASA